MKNILMIGGGVSGRAAAELAAALEINITVVSDNDIAAGDTVPLLANKDQVVVSPGVSPNSRLLQAALAEKLPVCSELEFGLHHFPGQAVAVTGTNGKTTTVELTTFLLQRLGLDAVAAGNIGLPVSAVAAQMIRDGEQGKQDKIAVLEVSSFQLEWTDYLPAKAAVLLNIESDHINRYPGGLSEYAAVKERIFQQVPRENCFYGMSMEQRHIYPGLSIDNGQLFYQQKKIIDLTETVLTAPHNQENLLAALSLAASVTDFSGQEEKIAAALRDFRTGDHRISLVAEKNSVRYIDDSKATNPAAVIAAVKSLAKTPQNNIILIAGGLDKEMDFSVLASLQKYLRKVIVYGECGANIGKVFAAGNDVFNAGSDFALAVRESIQSAQTGDIVLLSPAAASMDMFKDYKERGNVFAELVKSMI